MEEEILHYENFLQILSFSKKSEILSSCKNKNILILTIPPSVLRSGLRHLCQKTSYVRYFQILQTFTSRLRGEWKIVPGTCQNFVGAERFEMETAEVVDPIRLELQHVRIDARGNILGSKRKEDEDIDWFKFVSMQTVRG